MSDIKVPFSDNLDKTEYNMFAKLQTLSGKERQKQLELMRSIGLISPENDGFFGELADRTAGSFVGGMRGIGATIKETTGNDSIYNYFNESLLRNQQWNAPEEQTIGGYLGGAIGSAVGSTATALGASAVGTVIGGPKVGAALGAAAIFGQTFGENVERNREAGYSPDKAYGMAFLESSVDSFIEMLPGGIAGKPLKSAANINRIINISRAGKRELLNKVGQKVAAAVGQKEAQSLLTRWGKAAAVGGAGESMEEGLQYFNSYINQALGGDENANFSLNELADAMAQGFIGGFALGGFRTESNPETNNNTVAPEQLNEMQMFDQLARDVGDYLGIKVRFMDETAEGTALAEENNGMFDKNQSDTLFLNRTSYNENPAFTLGHELKHFIDFNRPDLGKAFDELLQDNSTDLGLEYLEKVNEKDMREYAGDIFGQIFAKPDTWGKVATKLNEKTPGMGEQFLQLLVDFVKIIKQKLKNYTAAPEAESMLKEYDKVEAQAVNMLAELRKNKLTAPEVTEEVKPESQSAMPLAPQAENIQTEPEVIDNKDESVIKENLTTEKISENRKSEDVIPEKGTSQDNSKEDKAEVAPEVPDNPAAGESFKEFFDRFSPQIPAIISKLETYGWGNKLTNDLMSVANSTAVKAYRKYSDPEKGKLDTYASRAVRNAIYDFWDSYSRKNTTKGGSLLSLNQTNEQGKELIDTIEVEDESASVENKGSSDNLLERYAKWKASLPRPVDRKILDYSEQGLAPSVIARKAGIGMTSDEVKTRLRELAAAARTEGELYFSRKRNALRKSLQERDESLTRVSKLDMREEISKVVESGIPEGKYVFRNQGEKQKIIDGAVKFLRAFSRKTVDLSDGRIAYFMPDKRALKRGDATAWAEYGIHAVTSSGKTIPGKEYNERLFNQKKFDNLDRIIPIIQDENVFGKFDDKNPDKDGVIFVGTSHDGTRLEVITRLDEYGNPQADLTEVTVLATRKEGKNPPQKPLSEVVEAVAQHQAAGFSPSTNDNIIKNFKNANDDLQFSKKRKHQQINPVVVNGVVRDEYADLLENKEYTPEKIAEWQAQALEWIEKAGGAAQAVKKLLNDQAPSNSAVAEIARRILLNSDAFFDNVSGKDRKAFYELEMDARSEWGRLGRSMQLNALLLKDVMAVQALLNKLGKTIPDAERSKLRDSIKKELDLDIDNLPEDIVNDKAKLDAVLRKYLAHKASFGDKLYEYWINGILSGPSTHAANFLGNTANAVYELGIKRFTEALVNIAAGRKDGATFGEFKQMVKAFNWQNALKAARMSFNLETLDLEGKFMEGNTVAIGGKAGRIIRTPGRLLKAADSFAKALIEPAETAAYAYRMGVMEGLSGSELQNYIQKQLTDKESNAYKWGRERSRELTFQEDTPVYIKRLMALRESGGAMGITLRLLLPFIKTPSNILKQGVRKSVLGSFNLAWESGKLALGKRNFDNEYISRVAEQLIAWGAFMVLAGLDDDDDMPIITGSSPDYGSAEYGFKVNKVPAYSIRIGDTWYSYQRIEPLATGLAAIADALGAMRDMRNGKDATAVMKKLVKNAGQTIAEKSYLDSIGEIVKTVQDPERNLMQPATNTLSSALPAFVRQIRQAFREEVDDNKNRSYGADFWKEQMFIVTNRAGVTTALPKIDYFGRPVKKDSWGNTLLSPLGRLLPIKRVSGDDSMDRAEQLVWNYNMRNPNAEWYPTIPQPRFTKDGRKYYFDGEDYTVYATESGKLAHRQINNAIRAGRLNANRPDEDDIKLIKKIFSRARKETRMQMMRENRAKHLEK